MSTMMPVADEACDIQKLTRKEEEECSVFFKFIDGKTLCMMVNLQDDDILSIKDRLSQQAAEGHGQPSFALASRDMFLVWNGKPLDDDSVLADYNIGTKQHTTVFCHERKRGGCFAVSFSVFMVIIASILGSTVTCGASLFLVPILMPLLLVLPLCCL